MAQAGRRFVTFGIAGLAAAVLLGWGGMTLTGKLQCQRLEEDYLNSVSGAKQAILLRELAPDSAAMASVSSGLAESEVSVAEQLLPKIYDECGQRAGQTAFRKGSQLLLGAN